MTSRAMSQCAACVRFVSPWDHPDAIATCDAFPDGIPADVLENRVDHRNPVSGDNGIRWKSNGKPFPVWAFDTPP